MIAAVQRELGMVEGFDVALEMSGSPAAIRSALAAMAHGGKLAQLGIPEGEVSLDLDAVIFKMLTISGIYGREMYETWYKMSVMLQSGLDIRPAITHRFAFRDHERPSPRHAPARGGKVLMDWAPLMADARPEALGPPLASPTSSPSSAQRQLFRPLRELTSAPGPVCIVDGREVISFSSNDYLGLTQHPRLRSAAERAVRELGAGSGAVRTIAGTLSLHEALERELADFKQVEATLVFQSGFAANTGVIPVVTGEADLIVSDAFDHASIIDGMRLSKARQVVYPHKDVTALRAILAGAVDQGRPEDHRA